MNILLRNICLTFSLFFFSSIVYPANAFENIALKATSVQTSFVSGWEVLSAVNDGKEPISSTDKQGAAYGNWNGSDNNRWHWVEYQWDKLHIISKSEVYWWTDGGGIQIPSDYYLQYWDIMQKKWVEVNGSRGAGVANQYHTIQFTPVLTNKIRINMISFIATGILEWKVWGEVGEQIPMNSVASIDKPLTKGETSIITLTALDANGIAVPGYLFKLDVLIQNEMVNITEKYRINNLSFEKSIAGYELPATNAEGKVNFTVEIPSSIDPKDGIRIIPMFKQALVGLGVTYHYIEPGLSSPPLTLFSSQNSVDESIILTFTENVTWRNAIQRVIINGETLNGETDYQISNGQLILLPSGGRSILTTAGSKQILIEAMGYENNLLSFQLLPGKPSLSQSVVSTVNKLFRGVVTQIVVTVTDVYGNAIANLPLSMNVEKINHNHITNEGYIIAGKTYSVSASAINAGTTNSNGKVELSLTIPAIVDKNDGLQLQFFTSEGKPFAQTIEYLYAGIEKNTLVQAAVKRQPDFSWERSAQSDNFVIFWGEKVKGNPADKSANPQLWFNTGEILGWLEDMYHTYADSVKILDKNGKNTSKYKFELVMNNTWKNDVFTGWAFGGSADNTIGSMWVDPNATRDNGVFAHEFTHACQAQVQIDRPGYGLNTPYAGFFWESHANWVRAIYNNDHSGLLDRYINTSMMHFSVTRRHYQNFAFLDYVYDTYGIQTTSDIWLKASPTQSHPLTSLRDSVLRYSQIDLNNDLARCAMRNVTWDYSMQNEIQRVMKNLDPIMVAREYTILDSLKSEPGAFIVPEHIAPGDYGYNIVPLYLNDGAKSITVSFRTLSNTPAGGAGSCYGFVAVNANGKARYSPVYNETNASTTFTPEMDDEKFFLVVTGAPKIHHNYEWEVGYPKVYRYPYVVRFDGAIPAGHKPGYNSMKGIGAGGPHTNGGGWVASTAKADASAYVGQNAQVLGTAQITGNARIEGYAIVSGSARVRENAVVKDHAVVGTTSNVSGNAVIEKTARIYGTIVRNKVVVTGSALAYNSTLNDNVILKDLAWFWNTTLSGTVIMGGDAEDYKNCNSGTYLEIKRLGKCDGIISHPYDQDVNPKWAEYIYPSGQKPTKPLNLKSSNITTSSVTLHWDAVSDDNPGVQYYILSSSNVIASANDTSFNVTGLDINKSYYFQVQARDKEGNLSEKSEIITVKTLLNGTEKCSLGNGIRIFPNPMTDELNIEIPLTRSATVQVVDILGKTLIKKKFSDHTKISWNELTGAGIYALTIEMDAKKYYHKVIVQ